MLFILQLVVCLALFCFILSFKASLLTTINPHNIKQNRADLHAHVSPPDPVNATLQDALSSLQAVQARYIFA